MAHAVSVMDSAESRALGRMAPLLPARPAACYARNGDAMAPLLRGRGPGQYASGLPGTGGVRQDGAGLIPAIPGPCLIGCEHGGVILVAAPQKVVRAHPASRGHRGPLARWLLRGYAPARREGF